MNKAADICRRVETIKNDLIEKGGGVAGYRYIMDLVLLAESLADLVALQEQTIARLSNARPDPRDSTLNSWGRGLGR